MRKTLVFTFYALLFSVAAQEEPSRSSNTSMPPILGKLHAGIEVKLAALDAALAKAAASLAVTGIDGADARKVLAGLRGIDPAVIDCVTVSPAGRIVAVEPAVYQKHEGADISAQPQVKALITDKKPVTSEVFRAVEGMEAVDMEYPVLGKDGALLGSVSILFNPGTLIGAVVWPILKGTPLDAWVAQKNGCILYDPDVEEIGLNILCDPAYAKQPEIVEFFKLASSREKGQASYAVKVAGKKAEVFVEAGWVTVWSHGVAWKLVVTKAVNSEPSLGRRTLTMLGLVSAEDALRKLASDDALKTAAGEGRDAEVLEALTKFYKGHVGLYSAQWVDAKGVNRCGYPKENSLTNYDFTAPSALLAEKTLEALKGKKEATFVDRLVEGNTGEFFLAPVLSGETYCGMIYFIRLR